MFRVLHIMPGADAGGISSVILNYYSFINRDLFHFDIALTTNMMGQNGKRLKELGADFYQLPLKSDGVHAYEQALEKLLQSHHYDAIHVHESETSYIALRIAKKNGIKCRIAHSHTTSPYVSLKGELRRLSGCILNYHYATTVIGCGRLAGERVFGKFNMYRKKAVVLPNAIDTKKFGYNQEVRTVMRDYLHVENKYVVGMVARLAHQKNHMFVLDFFRSIAKDMPCAHLLLVGNGPDEQMIKEYMEANNMSSYVTMLGRRDDVNRLYQAIDVFIMPSLYEGFPVAAVEAMASGLPVMLSDKITKELDFSSSVQYMPLKKQAWIRAIKEASTLSGREKRQYEPKENGLDIRDAVCTLEEIYRDGTGNMLF